jgi:hypothetical protein
MSLAALWGTSVGYTESQHFVEIEMTDGRLMVVSKETFDYLYCRLDEFTAALKENCIEYAIYQPNMSFETCPQWYVQAIEDGFIYAEENYSDYIFYCENGDIVMSPGSVVLRNFLGDLNYMEMWQFDKYYDLAGGEME